MYFPQDYLDQRILQIDNQTYADDFSYLLGSDPTTGDQYNLFIRQTLKWLMKDRLENKAQIYGVYWKCENLLQTVWKILKDNMKLFSFQDIMAMFDQAIRANDQFQDTQCTLYLPREAFVECLIQVMYELYYPSKKFSGKFTQWELNVKQTFQRLNDLAYYYLRTITNRQSRMIMFLLKLNQDIIQKWPK